MTKESSFTSQLALIRQDYRKHYLSLRSCLKNPLDQLELWLKQALDAQVAEPTAMTLATVSSEGKPSARIVLLKGVEKGQLVFFTNYESPKGDDLQKNLHAALVFFWPELERQVRITGLTQRLDKKKSDRYFSTRPYKSQLGAWASSQSEVIANKGVLLAKAAFYAVRYQHQVPRPPHWGGYTVTPEKIEFWQGQPSRLHDRVLYLKDSVGWIKKRLSP